MTHNKIWNAIDQLAASRGISCSALAKLSGLDATAFNKSKRLTSVGKEHWPSTYSIYKILRATNTTLQDFIKFLPPCDVVRDR